MANRISEKDFLRRVIIAGDPKDATLSLVRSGLAPASIFTDLRPHLAALVKVFNLGEWPAKIVALEQIKASLPERIYALVSELFSQQSRLAEARVALSLIKTLRETIGSGDSAESGEKQQNLKTELETKLCEFGENFPELVAAAQKRAVEQKRQTQVVQPPELNIEAALEQFSRGRDDRNKQRRKERSREILTGRIHQLSVNQLLQLIRYNPDLFDLDEEFEVDGEDFTLANYLTGWEQELGAKHNLGDKETTLRIKGEILAVIEDCVRDLTDEQVEVYLTPAIRKLTRPTSSNRSRTRRRDGEKTLTNSAELFAIFDEAASKLSQDDQGRLALLSNQDERMFILLAILRRISRSWDLQRDLGLAGHAALEEDSLRAYEDLARSELYKRRLTEEREKIENLTVIKWRKLQELFSERQVLKEEVIHDQFRLIVRAHSYYKALPEKIRGEVYGVSRSQQKRIQFFREELRPEARLPVFPFQEFYFPTSPAVSVKIAKKRNKTKRPGPSHTPPKPRPKRDKGIGPPIGEGMKVRIAPGELSQATSLTPRNKGVSHKKKLLKLVRQTGATA